LVHIAPRGTFGSSGALTVRESGLADDFARFAEHLIPNLARSHRGAARNKFGHNSSRDHRLLQIHFVARGSAWRSLWLGQPLSW
jgi:hypothetical protein